MGIMSDTAASAGATYAALPQASLAGIGDGKCFGLSNAWLGYRARSDNNFLRDIKNEEEVLAKAFHFQTMQASAASKADVAKENGLIRSADKDTKKHFQTDSDGLAAMADWICATALTSRYFLVSTDKHTMAAVGGGASCNRFYDPNSGIVSAYKGDTFKKFLKDFFTTLANHPKVDYWSQSPKKIEVVKHKKL